MNTTPSTDQTTPAAPLATPAHWWRSWWRNLSPARQDRFAALAPLAAVLLFMAAIVAAFWYLRAEEVEREHEALKRDVEYAQQRVRLRLLERQEQLMRVARDLSNQEVDRAGFVSQAESLISQHPELQAITWIGRAAASESGRTGARGRAMPEGSKELSMIRRPCKTPPRRGGGETGRRPCPTGATVGTLADPDTPEPLSPRRLLVFGESLLWLQCSTACCTAA